MSDTITVKITNIEIDWESNPTQEYTSENYEKELKEEMEARQKTLTLVFNTLYEFEKEEYEVWGIDSIIADRISDDIGWCINYVTYEIDEGEE